MEPIEKNLYQFYQFLGSAKQIAYKAEEGYETLSAEKNIWPQILFNLDQSIPADKLIPKIASDIDRKGYPSIFIAHNNYLTIEHAPLLKTYGIIPIKMLKGMRWNPAAINKPELPQYIKVVELREKNQLSGFANLINKELMAKDMLTSSEHWTDLSMNDTTRSMKIFGLLRQQELISTALVYTKDNNAGLYFIATGKDYRNKGLASALLNYILDEMQKSAINNVVLHANNLSFSLYEKFGFVHKNNFIIYKKI